MLGRAIAELKGGTRRVGELVMAGMDEAQFTSCVTDEKALKALNDRVTKYQADAKITGTPTFVINGKELTGEQSLAALDAAIGPLLK